MLPVRLTIFCIFGDDTGGEEGGKFRHRDMCSLFLQDIIFFFPDWNLVKAWESRCCAFTPYFLVYKGVQVHSATVRSIIYPSFTAIV